MRIGIDVGGTKIEGLLLDAEGREIDRRRLPTPRNDYSGTLKTIGALVAALEKHTSLQTSVGIGSPGSLSPRTRVMKNCNSTWLNGKPLKRDLEQLLAREVRLANDADCFALSEAVDGAGAGAECVFGVILGTGVGGGLALRQQVWSGPGGVAGEWGHNPLPWPTDEERPGPPCYCSRRGCIETFVSGTGLERDYKAASGNPISAEAIVDRADRGESRAVAAMNRYHHRLARSLATVVNLVEPTVIVLGGGMSNVPSLVTEVPSLWGEYVFSDTVETRLLQAAHGDSSGVRGAAWLW